MNTFDSLNTSAANSKIERNNFIIEDNEPFEVEYEILPSEGFDCLFEIDTVNVVWGSIEGDITEQTDLIDILDAKVDVTEFEQEIEDINERIDATLNNIVGSYLIGVERDNHTVTITSKTFVFEQGVASDVWTIQHNLNKRPSIHLVDSTGREFEAEKDYINDNEVVIHLDSATTGKAYLN